MMNVNNDNLSPDSPLKCYSDSGSWRRYIDCDSVRGYMSCYTRYTVIYVSMDVRVSVMFRYDIGRRQELSRGCSTHQLQHQQHECESQVDQLVFIFY